MEQRELTLAPESVGLRLDRWLAEQCPDLSRSQLQNLIEAGSVLSLIHISEPTRL